MARSYEDYIEVFKNSERVPFSTAQNPLAAVCFPNDYPLGTANVGFSQLIACFSGIGGFERFFYFRRYPEKAGYSFESGKKLSDFPVSAFSIPYEHDLINVLRMLDNGGILDNEKYLKIAGGFAPTLNPEPFAPFFDMIFLGEADTFWKELAGAISIYDVFSSKTEILEKLNGMSGVYIPSLRQESLEVRKTGEHTELVSVPQFHNPAAHFGDARLIDICRGCRFKCNFCASGFSRKKPLYRELDSILNSENKTDKLGLIGSIVSDHPDFDRILSIASTENIQLGISSLRLDEFSSETLLSMRKLGIRSLTIAPETGSDRLREVCAKNITNRHVLETAGRVSELGFKTLKLYFMIGLPTEKKEDLEAIIELCNRISETTKIKTQASIAVFTPKARTPFQYARFITKAEFREKASFLKQGFISSKCGLTLPGYREACHSALLSLGTRDVGLAFRDYIIGGTNLKSALKNNEIDENGLLHSNKDFEYQFPWDRIDGEFNKKTLYNLYLKALGKQGNKKSPADRAEID
ncbi:MAG: radical SAM protein [candidate division Zixibacteria bacterium]|nr:radical SAM protein [candidate division Zixibacteria bacterium]